MLWKIFPTENFFGVFGLADFVPNRLANDA